MRVGAWTCRPETKEAVVDLEHYSDVHPDWNLVKRLEFRKAESVEKLLKSAWTSHEASRKLGRGGEHEVPPVRVANRARNRMLKPYPNPVS